MSDQSAMSGRIAQQISVPAGMEIEAGSPFQKIWVLQNDGNRAWQGVRLMHQGGDLPTAVNWHPVPDALPGQEVTLAISLAAPSSPGRYTSRWKLFGADGSAFGPQITIQIVAIPGGANNGRMLSYTTNGQAGLATADAGSKYTHQLTLDNTGGRRWRSDYQLVFVGGDATPDQPQVALPATIPGDNNQVELTLTADNINGVGVTYWQMRDNNGVAFGGFVAPEVRIRAAETTPVVNDFDPASWRGVVWDITSVFESGRVGGNPAAYQTRDSGIVSYGKHQATLASGNLQRVLTLYYERSHSAASQELQQNYNARVQVRDEGLRHDARFKELLLQAANEDAMDTAQDDVFATNFYEPALHTVNEIGLRSPLGVACTYDTRVQHGGGGLGFLVKRTREALGGVVGDRAIDEGAWLTQFLYEREGLLNRLADKQDAAGSSANANALRTSTFRVRELRQLLTANNYTLSGSLSVRGFTINGL